MSTKYNVEDSFQAAVSLMEAMLEENDEAADEIIDVVTEDKIIDGLMALSYVLLSNLQDFLPDTVTKEEMIAKIRLQQKLNQSAH